MMNKLKRLIKSKKFKKYEFILLFGLAVVIVLSAFIIGTSSVVQRFSNKAEEIKYIEENGMKFISIGNGYLAEELKVQAGSLLPKLKDYFNDNYELDKNATITYLDGKDNLEVRTFAQGKQSHLLGFSMEFMRTQSRGKTNNN